MRILTTALATLIVALGAAAVAAPAAEGGRYQLAPTEGGYLRLDRETGATAFCKPAPEGYACRPVAEEGRPAGDRVAEIEKRISALEDRLKASGAAASGKAAPDLPSEEQMNRVTSFIERAVKRLRQLAEELQKEDPAPADRQRL